MAYELGDGTTLAERLDPEGVHRIINQGLRAHYRRGSPPRRHDQAVHRRWNHGAVRRPNGAWLFGSVVHMKRRISRALRGYATMGGSRYPPKWTDSVVHRRERTSLLEGDR